MIYLIKDGIYPFKISVFKVAIHVDNKFVEQEKK